MDLIFLAFAKITILKIKLIKIPMPIMTRANTPQFFKQHSQSLEEQELTKPTIGVAIIDNIIIVNTCMTV
jgi:hypothetical protein